ncbi:transposase [Myxococcota bacterium]
MKRRAGKRRKPKQHQLTEAGVDALLQKLRAHGEQALTDDDYDALLGVVQTWAHITEIAAQDSASIREIRRLLGIARQRDNPRASTSAPAQGEPTDDAEDHPEAGESPSDGADKDEDGSDEYRDPHGRRNADNFEQLEQAHHAHVTLHSGDCCPSCLRGRVYKYRPSTFTTISGRSPLVATRHTVESLQCNLCKEVFRAPLPAVLEADGVSGRVLYTHSAVAMVCILRCFGGLPMHRQDRLQKALGVPVPDASIWDMHERLANAMRPVWRHLVTQSANARLFFGDDTGATIISCRSKVRPDRRTGELKRRTGCHTTCVIAVLEDEHAAVLFLTGIHHTGEVMDLIVADRDPALPPPIFMGDCIESNTVTTARVYYAGCNVHAIRRFKELAENYPEHADYALERYGQIYKNEAKCIKAKLSPEQRCVYHREHSRKLLRQIAEYGEDMFEQRRVEPNSDLGEAFEYVIGNERRLAAFARHPNAPLDNNRVERALRTSVRLRETTHFFRNPVGAGVADTILTVGATALHTRVNLFEYFVELQRHAEEVRADPGAWVPWRYQARRRQHGIGPPAAAPPIVAVT